MTRGALAVPVLAAGAREPRVGTPRTRRVRVSRVRASSRQTCAGPGTLRGPVCRVPASSRQTCTGPVHMGALLAGGRELGPDECHHWLDHVRNCETCTGPFVKTLIAQLVYLVLCGIRLIPHGTRLARVRGFLPKARPCVPARYTSAASLHGPAKLGCHVYGARRLGAHVYRRPAAPACTADVSPASARHAPAPRGQPGSRTPPVPARGAGRPPPRLTPARSPDARA